MSSAIHVQNLGKKYILSHQKQERYTALRDVLTEGARYWTNKLLNRNTSAIDPAHEEFWAIRDLNFDIKQGDRVGIIGRNGAGKSTLLKILSRITEPTTGQFKTNGRVASLLEVGTGFHPELTGRENIFLNGAILGMSKAEIRNKFDEIVAFAEIERFLDTPVKRYSSGMYVRLAFAVAAHLEPEILIVDEVLAVGDAQFQKKCLGKMNEVSEQGRTILFVSHNMAALSSLCKKGFFLSEGKIEYSGDVDSAIKHYLSNSSSIKKLQDSSILTSSLEHSIQITDFICRSNSTSEAIICGEGMRFEINYVASRENLSIQFLIGIYDNYKTSVLFLDSDALNFSTRELPKSGRITVDLSKDFSLFPGTYTVNIAASVNTELVYHVQNALEITVHESDFFGTGRWPQGKPLALVKQSWSVEAQ